MLFIDIFHNCKCKSKCMRVYYKIWDLSGGDLHEKVFDLF